MPSEIQRVGFGCVALSTHATERRALNCLRVAWECGIRHFDTAPLYGQGYSEAILGRFLQSLPLSERVEALVTSKFGLGLVGHISLSPRVALPLNYLRKQWAHYQTPRSFAVAEPMALGSAQTRSYSSVRVAKLNDVQQQFECTMRRLGVERLSLYLGHELAPSGLTDEVMGYLSSRMSNGDIKQLGLGSDVSLLQGQDWTGLEELTVLQYRGQGDEYKKLTELNGITQHIHHSIIARNTVHDGPYSRALVNHLRRFPLCKVLFSTTKASRIRENLSGLN